MQRYALKMTSLLLIDATNRARQRKEESIRLARAYQDDSQFDIRMAACLCQACYYPKKLGGILAGAAMTTQDCMSCALPQQYGSTYTDALCLLCAQKHALCKHCGGDVQMVIRDAWPTPNKEAIR